MSDTPLDPKALFAALAQEMATAVAALIGESTAIADGTPAGPLVWHARLTVSGRLAGTIELGLGDEDGRRVSALIMGFDGEAVTDEAVVDTLREICAQAVGALAQATAWQDVTLALGDVVREEKALDGSGFAFPLPGDLRPVIVVDGSLGEPGPQPVATAVASDAPAARPAAAPPANVGNLDLLLDMELPLAVRFGQTEMTLLDLTRLGPGSVIDLHRSTDDPVEVLVSGKVIARGEVVVVDGNYGVRVTEVVSTADRIRSLGA